MLELTDQKYAAELRCTVSINRPGAAAPELKPARLHLAWAPLAGDTIRSAADPKVPMVAVCLPQRRGYFYQRLDAYGNQQEEPVTWAIHGFLAELPERAAVDLEGRTIRLRAWRYDTELQSNGNFL